MSIQYFGSAKEILIRVPPQQSLNSADISSKILNLLSTNNIDVEMRRVEFVGPQVGEELKEDGGLAMLYALLCIMIYVALRFQMRFSVGAVAALVHDVVITLGFFSFINIGNVSCIQPTTGTTLFSNFGIFLLRLKVPF